MMRVIILFIAFFQIGICYSGTDVGNGGGAWACLDDDQNISWLKILDIYEATVEFRLTPRQFSTEDPLQIALSLAKFIEKVNPIFADLYFKKLNLIKNQINFTDSKLNIITDYSYFRSQPSSQTCPDGKVQYIQIVNFTNYTTILINRKIWQSLTYTQKAAIYTHEAIYSLLRELEQAENSLRTRYLVGILFSEVDIFAYKPQFKIHTPKNGMTQNKFNQLIDNFENKIMAFYKDRGFTLKIQKKWDEGLPQTYISRIGKTLKMSINGGMGRFQTMSEDAFTLVLCSTLGQALLPKNDVVPDYMLNEGGYWATSKCLRVLWNDENNLNLISNIPHSIELTSACLNAHNSDPNNSALCIRSALAAKAFTKSIKIFMQAPNEVSLLTHDPSIVESTTINRTPQCRLDNLYAGALCPIDYKIPLSSKNGSCHKELYPRFQRPLCWFKP